MAIIRVSIKTGYLDRFDEGVALYDSAGFSIGKVIEDTLEVEAD